MAELKDWDKTAANNNSTPPDGLPEFNAPSDVNNWARESMAVLARYYEIDNAALMTTGTASSYAISPTGTVTLGVGQKFLFRVHVANTASPSLSINGAGALPMMDLAGNALVANRLQANAPYIAIVDSGATGYYIMGVADSLIDTVRSDLDTLLPLNAIVIEEASGIRVTNAASGDSVYLPDAGGVSVFDGTDEVFHVSAGGNVLTLGDVTAFATSVG